MNQTEEVFVTTFIQKRRRERAIFELESESRRGGFLNRLCHNFFDVFDERYLQPIVESGLGGAELLKMLKKKGAGKTCHVISCNEAIDGKQIPIDEAIEAAMGFGLPSILICKPDSLAYFEAEQEQGAPPRYLLVKS